MKTYIEQNSHSITLLSPGCSKTSSFVYRFLRLTLMAVFILSLFFIVILSGVGMGNSGLNKTLYVGDTEVQEVQSILIDDSSLVQANAASGGSAAINKVFSDGNTNINKTLTHYIYNQNMSGYVSYMSYWAGKSSNTNIYQQGNGKFGVYGSGTVRQKRITMNAYVNFELGPNLQALAAAGKLQVTVSGTFGTGNGYDQDYYAGVRLSPVTRYASENGGDTRLGGFNSIASGYRASAGSGGFTLSNVSVPTDTKYLILGVACTCNYTSLIGGRLPDSYMEGQTLTFTSTDTVAPTIKLETNYYRNALWQTSRTVAFRVYDAVATSTLQSIRVYGNGTQIFGVDNPSNSTGNLYNSTLASNFVSGLTASAIDRSGNNQPYITYYNSLTTETATTTATNVPQTYLKIDTTAPTINSVKFVQSGNPTQEITGPYSGAVSMLITVTDSQSGVGQVFVTNSNGGITNKEGVIFGTPTRNSYPDSVCTGVYKVDLDNYANGDYTVVVRDNARDSAGSIGDGTRNGKTQAVGSFSYQDFKAPVIATPTMQYNKRSSSDPLSTSPTSTLTGYTAGSSVYANNYITMTFTITDTTGSNYSNGNNLYAQLSAVKVMYLYGTELRTVTATLQGGYPSFSNPTRTYLYKCDLPYLSSTSLYTINAETGLQGSGVSCKGYTIWTIDLAGNPSVTTNIEVKIDTIAPLIYSRTVSSSDGMGNTAGKGSLAYANKSITLTVTCTDLSDSSNINNGSGIKAIYIYRDSSIVVSKVDFSGSSVTHSFTLSDNSSNGRYYYRIVVVDQAGNTSQWGVGNALGITDYYNNANIETTKIFNVLKDDVVPVIKFFYSIDGGANYIYQALTANDTFTFPWSKASSVKFKFEITMGSSGGSFIDLSNSTTVSSRVQGIAVTGTPPNYVYTPNVTYNVDNYVHTVPIEKVAEGTQSYRYQFVNGANVTVFTPTIVTKIDRTAPTITLLGFGDSIADGSTFTTKEQATASIVKLKTEDSLTNETAWLNAASLPSIYGIFFVDDTFSGVGTDAINNSTGSQASSTTVTVNFSHNGYTYSWSATPVKYGNIYLVQVRFWHPDEMSQAKKGPTSFCNVEGEYDLLNGTKLRYNISLFDFIGNEGKAYMKGNNVNMEYCVDPFEIRATLISIVEVDDNDVSTPYNCVDWTRNKVVVTLKKVISLTPTRTKWGSFNITDMPNGTIQGGSTDGADIGAYGDWKTIDGDSDTAKTVTMEFPAISRCSQVFFQIYNSSNGVGLCFGSNDFEYFYIRQDTSKPILQAIAFSTNPALKIGSLKADNADILIFYEYSVVDDVGIWTRTSNNAAINVWSTGSFVKKQIAAGKITYTEDRLYLPGVYMYILATDTQGTGGTGSGIDRINIKLDGTAYETLYLMNSTIASSTEYNVLGGGTNPIYTGTLNNTDYYTPSTGVGMYCTGAAAKLYGYATSSELKSLEFNLIDKQGNFSNISVTNDKYGKKIMPVIDNTMPKVSLTAATYGGVNYISGDFFAGNAIKQDLNVKFEVSSGVSGAKLYWRLGTYDVPLDASNPYKVYNTTEIPFGLITKTQGISSWTEMYTYSLPNSKALVSYNIDKNNFVKNRFEVLLVTTTGAFYYLDCGNVFIDITPPTIEESMTFYTRASDSNNLLPIVNYDSINKVNEVVTGRTVYTNDSIYAYFYIFDTASEVSRVYYKNGTEETDLDVVSVKRIVNSIEVTTFYYRLKIDIRNMYKITAVDGANNSSESSSFQPNIDKTEVAVYVEAKKDDGSNYILGEGNTFTNSAKVKVTITVNYGASGFGGISYNIDGGDWSPISTGMLFNVFWEKTSDINQHKVVIDFVDEQNSVYNFRAYNTITENYAIGGVRPLGINTMKIAIDKTVPSIDLAKGNYSLLTTIWHGVGQSLNISINDLSASGQQGSGVNTVKLDYSILGAAQDAIPMTLSGGLFTSSKTLDHYVDYVITMTDKAGNTATQLIRPRIDKKDPVWGTYEGATPNYKLLTASEGTVYTANTWSKDDIKALVTMIYSMSGVQLQYYRYTPTAANPTLDPANIANNLWTVLSGGNGTWSEETPVIADSGKTMEKVDVEYLISILSETNVSQYHYLRMVSGAGRTSTVLSLGFVRIDKEKPTIAIASKINNNNTNWGTINEDHDTTTFASWTSSDLTMNVSSTATLVSGYTVFYRLSLGSPWIAVEYNYSGSAVTYTYGVTNNIPDAKKMKLIHKVSESTNNAVYQYYIKSGSGMESIIYTISGIKIDTASPNLSVAAKTSNIFGTDNIRENETLLNTASLSEYTAASGSYTIANPSWVSTNSVIVAVSIKNVSYSGVSLYINGSFYEKFSYGIADTTKYYVVSKTMALNIRLVSNAAKETLILGNVKIDNDIPIVYVAGEIAGTEASNFSAVSSFEDKWYTSKITITLVVGRYINNGGTYTYEKDTTASNDEILSGYTIYYSINGGEWISNDQVLSVNANNIDTLGNPIAPIRNTYRFKIVSGSGMSFELGNNAISNTGTVVKTVSDIKTIIQTAGGLIKNLNELDYLYTVNVDSRDFTIIGNHIMELTMANGNSYNWTVSASDNPVFSKDTVYKSSDGTSDDDDKFIINTDVSFKRGDYLRIKYNTSDYKFIFRYTNYGNYDGTNWTGTITSVSTGNSEKKGYFDYIFVNNNLSYNSYFMKELTATYENLKLYLQSDSVATVGASADFIYKNAGGANEKLNLKFNYIYKDMNGVLADKNNLSVGGYVVSAVISDNNVNSFRLSNPAAVLLVKYFTENVTEVNSSEYPYTIYNEIDLGKITSTYYDGYTESDGVFTLNSPSSYLENHYIVNNNLDLTDTFTGISGTFTGTFNGNNKAITLAGGAADSYYGLFNKLSGSVTNLDLSLRKVLTLRQTVLAGILAREIVNGTVNNVYISGSISLVDCNLNASVGGLAGYVQDSAIGGEYVQDSETGEIFYKAVYVDISIYNNGNNIQKAYIGGLIGYVGTGTTLKYTYSYGDIKLHNMGSESKVGTVFGMIDSYINEGNRNTYYFNNYYLDKATFVNANAVNSFSSSVSVINDAQETLNTIRSRDFSEFVGTNTGSGDVGGLVIVNKLVRNIVLVKLYKDMKLPYTYTVVGGVEVLEINNGEGTFDSNLVISDVNQFRMMDKYVTLYYILSEDLDFSNYDEPIAENKIFYGSIDGDHHTITNFGSNVNTINGKTYGLVGNLAGTVKGFIFENVDVDATYTGSGKLAAGLIAGIMYESAKVSDIIALGNIAISATTAVNIGGVAGEIYGGNVYDVFVMDNLKVVGTSINIGGIAGLADNARIASYTNGLEEKDGAVFSIGRVESISSSQAKVGSVIGSGTLSNSTVNKIFAINNNTYSNGNMVVRTVGSVSGDSNMAVTEFTDPSSVMRGTYFSDNTTNVFGTVFGNTDERLYPLAGLGTANNKFIVKSNAGNTGGNDFKYINQALFASYNIEGDITFAAGEFQTIGKGLIFTGTIDGKNADSVSAEEGSVSSLLNVTDALIYRNRGSVTDLVVNVSYTKVVEGGSNNEYDLIFGAIAIYNEGVIRNVTVSGNIDISALNSDSTVVVSGFVGIDLGGTIEGDNKIQNSISGLNITIDGVRTVYAGGYIGIVDGLTTLSYGIGSGTLAITNSSNVYAGTLIGEARYAVDVSSLAELSEYQYFVTIDEVPSTNIIGATTY